MPAPGRWEMRCSVVSGAEQKSQIQNAQTQNAAVIFVFSGLSLLSLTGSTRKPWKLRCARPGTSTAGRGTKGASKRDRNVGCDPSTLQDAQEQASGTATWAVTPAHCNMLKIRSRQVTALFEPPSNVLPPPPSNVGVDFTTHPSTLPPQSHDFHTASPRLAAPSSSAAAPGATLTSNSARCASAVLVAGERFRTNAPVSLRQQARRSRTLAALPTILRRCRRRHLRRLAAATMRAPRRPRRLAAGLTAVLDAAGAAETAAAAVVDAVAGAPARPC
eukprot:365850-Chlamydomonas_euryale.AAC.5